MKEGEIDQHQGSYEIGILLKRLYIDSALKQDNTKDKDKSKSYKKAVNKISLETI